MKRIFSAAWLVLLSFCVSGCGGGPNGPSLTPVTGTVTYKGAGLGEVNVMFMPESGPAAFGTTDAEGHFSLKTNGRTGAVSGKHLISVSSAESAPMPGTPEAKNASVEKKFLDKYANPKTSNLTATVPGDGQPVKIELKD